MKWPCIKFHTAAQPEKKVTLNLGFEPQVQNCLQKWKQNSKFYLISRKLFFWVSSIAKHEVISHFFSREILNKKNPVQFLIMLNLKMNSKWNSGKAKILY